MAITDEKIELQNPAPEQGVEELVEKEYKYGF